MNDGPYTLSFKCNLGLHMQVTKFLVLQLVPYFQCHFVSADIICLVTISYFTFGKVQVLENISLI